MGLVHLSPSAIITNAILVGVRLQKGRITNFPYIRELRHKEKMQLRFRFLVGLFAVCLVCCIIWCPALNLFNAVERTRHTLIYSRKQQQETYNGKQKIMLMWTTFFGDAPGTRVHLLNECPDLKDKCLLTADRSLVGKADAVVFHFMSEDFNLNDLPKARSSSQRYVFLTVEAPPTYKAEGREMLHAPPNFFNWTMTYRYDSDIPWVYGGYWISPDKNKVLGFKPEFLPYDQQTILENKTGAIFWLVSNCNTVSRREIAVGKLGKYIMIDKYGACAENPYKRDACMRADECEKDLGSMNFFYIAIENTVCKNYVTEKYFGRYHLPSIPIVMRRKVYENIIPTHSFIPMDDFESARDMADYLIALMANKTAYLEYFKWRREGWVRTYQGAGYRFHFCKLCEALLENRSPKVYKNVEEWFHGTSECEGSEFAESWKEE